MAVQISITLLLILNDINRHRIVTVNPPTLDSRKNTVRVRNETQSQLALLYSTSHTVTQHYIVSHAYTVTIRHQQTPTLSGSLKD